MSRHSDNPEDLDRLREKIIGLGERSVRKTYYPELQEQLHELEEKIKERDREISDRRRAEEALRTSRHQLQSIIDNSNAVIYLKDPDSRFILINKRFEDLFHVTSESVVGKTDHDIFPKDQADAFRAFDQYVISTGTTQEAEEVAPQDDGLHTYISIKTPLYDGTGKIYAICGISTDITERKLAEEERLSHIRFLEGLELVEKAIRQADSLEGMMTNVLDAALSIFGSDRAWLLYPCDPEAPSWRVPMERTRPEYPGALSMGVDLPTTPEARDAFVEGLSSSGPVVYDPQTGRPLPPVSRQFSVQSQIMIVLYPKIGKPWLLGMHQCSYIRIWSDKEQRLFTEISRRMADGLSSLLSIKDLQESEERYRIVTLSALDAIITIDEESSIVFANPSTERIFGYTTAEITGCRLTMLMPERFRNMHLAGIKRHIATGERHIQWSAIEFPGLHKDGREIPLEISYGEFVKGGKYFFTGIVRDITERKKAEETIKYQAFHDLLTGLPNRAQLMLRLGIELTQAQFNQKALAVLHIDLDRFRTINDTLGHVIGDQVIVAVSERLKALIRDNDTLARIGSDEFIILLADLMRAEEAALFARKLVDSMRKSFRFDDQELYTTASVGISMYPEDSKNADVLLKNADIAVSHVKERGRNNYQFFNPTLNRRTIERLLLESGLRRTIERGELVLHYQPQVSIRTGEITCFEALVRWQHADLGLLGPTQFIPAAEEIGFVTAIDEWVLRAACNQNKAWQAAGYPPLCVTVNLSAQQFQQPTLVELVSEIVHETGLDPHHLGIEVTESTAMHDINIAIPNLRGLHNMGIKLAIDDFGTGYSSLNYLKRFPINKLKIDQSFIRGVAEDPDDQAIVSAVIAMGHSLKLEIIAEGVETTEQLSFLRSRACDEMQGFLFSKPVPSDDLGDILALAP